jgi:hypothetical protein
MLSFISNAFSNSWWYKTPDPKTILQQKTNEAMKSRVQSKDMQDEIRWKKTLPRVTHRPPSAKLFRRSKELPMSKHIKEDIRRCPSEETSSPAS